MNFLKAYKERIEEAPGYYDDYVYYLLEIFINDYIPKVLEENLSTFRDVDIRIQDLETYFLNIFRNNIMSYIRHILEKIKSGELKENDIKTPIGKLALEVYKIVSSGNLEENENHENVQLEVSKKVDDYAKKFTYHIPKVLELIYTKLPFSLKEGHIVGDLNTIIRFYYNQEQCDFVIRELTPEEEELKAYTRKVFNEQVVMSFIPEVIKICKEKKKKKVSIQYSIDKGVARFGTLDFNGLDLYEFGKCLKSLPGKELTMYPRPKDRVIKNEYEFEFQLQDLETFYNNVVKNVPQGPQGLHR